MNNTAIVIPIKTNNQRLPGKNTRRLHDRPLFEYLFNTVGNCNNVDSIYVDSSDKGILELAKLQGFKTIQRPIELNTPETSGNDLLRFEMEHIDEAIICQCFVTLPFLSAKTIDASIGLLRNSSASSVLALSRVENRFWFNGAPVNHDFKTLQGTQYESPIYVEAGFYTFEKQVFLEQESRVTDDHVVMYVDQLECVDIDTEFDFLFAETLINSGLA